MEAGKILVIDEIRGNKVITDFYQQEYLTPVGKTERQFNDIVVGDGWLSVPINKIGTGLILLANSTNAKIRITTSEPATSILSIGGSCKWKFTATFAATITAIDIATDSTTAVDVMVSLIGF